MHLQLDLEESHQLFTAIIDSLIEDISFAGADGAAIKRWRSESMRTGSEGMKELAARINADIERALTNKTKSAITRPDWK